MLRIHFKKGVPCLLVILAIFFAIPRIWSQPLGNGLAYLKRVEKRYEKVLYFRAKFTQISQAPGVVKAEKATGIVYFRKDGKFRWDYNTPDITLIISDGKTLWIYEPEDRQVIVDRNFRKRLKKFPYTFLNGIGRLDRDFETTIENQQQQIVTLKLIPKEPIKEIKVVRVSFSTKTFLIHQVSWTSPQGVKTVITFNDIDITSKIPDSVFQFEPPPGVDAVNAQAP